MNLFILGHYIVDCAFAKSTHLRIILHTTDAEAGKRLSAELDAAGDLAGPSSLKKRKAAVVTNEAEVGDTF